MPELWTESLASAGMLGRIVTCGALGGGAVETNMRAFYVKHLSLLGSRGAPMSQIQEVYRLAGGGKLRPVMAMVWAWWRKRSRMALAAGTSPRSLPQSWMGRLLVMMVERFS